MIVFTDILRSNMFLSRQGKLGYSALCLDEVKELIDGKNAAISYSALEENERVPGENARMETLKKQLHQQLPRLEAADITPGDQFILVPEDVQSDTATYVHVWVEKD